MTSLRYGLEPTPVGPALIAVTDDGVVSLQIIDGSTEPALERLIIAVGVPAELDRDSIEPCAEQVREYFDGDRRSFDLPMDWRLTRGLAAIALQAICEIPYGETASYGEIAIAAGAPGAARAVGTACANSPFSLVVPVHRVVRADGSLGEYGGRPDIKRFLIEHELSHPRLGSP